MGADARDQGLLRHGLDAGTIPRCPLHVQSDLLAPAAAPDVLPRPAWTVRRWGGKTDPWIDLLLKPSGRFDQQDRAYLISNPWNALYMTEIMLARFPEYRALKIKALQGPSLTEQDIREIKFWFFLAYFDPDFLEGRVDLADGSIVDLTDLVRKQSDGTYVLKQAVEEDDCNRILAETYKILANIIPVHKKLMYDPVSHKGQIQIATTPYYHPILPLLADSDAARRRIGW